MVAPSYLTTDQDTPKLLPRTRPGWAPKPRGKVKLVHGWATPDEGAGQDVPQRDDWRLGLPQPDPQPLVADAPAPDFMPQPPPAPTGPTGAPPQSTPAPQQSLTAPPEPATTTAETGTSALPRAVIPRPAAQVSRSAPTQAGVVKGAQAPPPQGPPPASRLVPTQQPTQQSFVAQNLGTALQIETETGIPHQLLLAIP